MVGDDRILVVLEGGERIFVAYNSFCSKLLSVQSNLYDYSARQSGLRRINLELIVVYLGNGYFSCCKAYFYITCTFLSKASCVYCH